MTTSSSAFGAIANVWRLVGPLRRKLAQGIALRMLQGLLQAVPVAIVVVALDDLVDEGGVSGEQIATWTAIIAASVVAQFLVGLRSSRLTWIVGYDAAADIRLRTVDHLRQVPMGQLGRRQSGDVTTVLTTDIRMIEPALADVLPTMLGASVAPVVLVAVTLAVDWRLGLAALSTLVVAIPVFLDVERRFAVLATERQARQASAVARMLEYITGIAVIRAYNQTGERMARFRDALDEFRATNLRLVHKLTPLLTAITLTIELSFAAVLLMTILLATGGNVETSTVLVFLVLALRIYQPILAVVSSAEVLRISAASLQRLTDLLALDVQAQPVRPRQRDGFEIAFEDVSFTYDTAERPVLSELSFTVPEGSLTALVGPSGAGKSTVANLVARFWDVRSGHVRIGGVDVRDMDPDALMQSLTVVLQDSYLFCETIAANLRLADPDASDERLAQVARAAHCHEFISALPDGYATVVGEGGATLSGGERQRICIARALLKDAPIVILDEPTAAIDATSERRLQAALGALVADKTVLVIAHRLTTIRGADQILVLDDGHIVEHGRHEDLVAARGRYAGLWQAQQDAHGWRVASRLPAELGR